MYQDPIPLRYRGGLLGAFAPLALFLAGVAWLGLSGAPGEQGFWPILVAAISLGMLLCRDRHAYAEAVIEGMSQPIIMVMILAWLLAGILAALMKATGFVQALVWLSQIAGVHGVGYVVAAFLISCAVSTSTGTSLGTLILCSPLLYPAGGLLEAPPALLLGAILGGATFGDNISPVSDTTIASTVTQGARMGEVVRSRLRYALPAASIALLATVILGSSFGGVGDLETADTARSGAEMSTSTPGSGTGTEGRDPTKIAPTGRDALELDGGLPASAPRQERGQGTAGQAEVIGPEDASSQAEVLGSEPNPRGLPMLLAPALVIILLFRHVHLLEGLIIGILVATVLGLVLNLITFDQLLYVDVEAHTAGGVLVEGMSRGVGVSIFTILLMGLVAGLEASGVLRRLLQYAGRHIDSQRSAEWWAFGAVSTAALVTTHSVVALLAVGPFARETGFRQGIPATRRANILDTTVCTYPFLLPYCIPTILAASTTAVGPDFGMPVLSAATAGLYNLHSWALLVVVLTAIATGWGRHADPDTTELTSEPQSPWARRREPDSSTSSSFFDMMPPKRRPFTNRPQGPSDFAQETEQMTAEEVQIASGSISKDRAASGEPAPPASSSASSSSSTASFEETERIELTSQELRALPDAALGEEPGSEEPDPEGSSSRRSPSED